MLGNYLVTALRQLWKNKFYSGLNTTGLVTGIVCFLFITVYVTHELSYDGFNQNKDRIYRLTLGSLEAGKMTSCVTGGVMPAVLKDEYAGIESFARFRHLPSLVTVGEKAFFEQRFFYSDSSVFNVFTFELVSGDAATALRDPFTIVLTRSTAERYFGQQDPVGHLMQVDETMTFKVTGVMEDVPANAHLHFDMLASTSSLLQHPQPNVRTWQLTSWYSHYFHNYILLEQSADPKAVGDAIRDAAKFHSDPTQYESFGKNMGLFLQPLRDIHLSPLFGEIEAQGDATVLIILGSVATVILVLACVNFANISMMLSLGRRREVGLRKTLGARKAQIWVQFTGEAFVLSFFAFVLSAVIAQSLLPWFNTFSGKDIHWGDILSQEALIAFACALVVTSLAGGLYPALASSSLTPAAILRGTLTHPRAFGIRKGIIVLQFTVSIVLVAGSLVVWKQVNYMLTRDLGLNASQVIVIPTYGDPRVNAKLDFFHKQLATIPNVVSSTTAESIPGEAVFGIVGIFEGHPIRNYSTLGIGYDYLETFGMELAAGRNFSREISSDTSTNCVIINEALARQLGWTAEQAIGKSYNMGNEIVRPGKVIGVVKDFHFNSLRNEIRPLVMSYIPFFFQQVPVRIDSDNIPTVIAAIGDVWKSVYPGRPFDFRFADASLQRQYDAEEKFGTLITCFSVLAIVIGLLGMIGMVSLDLAMRTREIGIRKVLGATVQNLVLKLSRGFLGLVTIAAAISLPLSWWLSAKWLSGFAYRIDTIGFVVLAPAFGIILLAGMVLTLQTMRRAGENPADSLRTE
jgi:putative ABC transport system permease protein